MSRIAALVSTILIMLGLALPAAAFADDGSSGGLMVWSSRRRRR